MFTLEFPVHSVDKLLFESRLILFIAKNIWKKKFFEEKRKTGSLDDQVNRLRHEVDVQHKVLMSYLESKGMAWSRRFSI